VLGLPCGIEGRKQQKRGPSGRNPEIGREERDHLEQGLAGLREKCEKRLMMRKPAEAGKGTKKLTPNRGEDSRTKVTHMPYGLRRRGSAEV